MIEELKKNIETEISILREIANFQNKFDFSDKSDQRLLSDAISNLVIMLKTVNNSIPDILNNISSAKKLPTQNKTNLTNLEKVRFSTESKEIEAVVSKKDRDRFLQELSLNESLIRKIKDKSKINENAAEDFKAARGYIKLSNKFFLNNSISLMKQGYFKPLSLELKKANLDILTEAYVSMIFLSTTIAFILSIFISLVILFLGFASGSGISSSIIAAAILIPLIIPIITFVSIYFYPSTEKSSIAKRIDQELPFAVIHMSAISGSGIAPSEIFRIIGLSKEYPFLKKEVRKILNQLNLYGYDLVTALTNVSKTTPSNKFAELLSGLSTTINSGGDLQEFFQKRAETLLLDYRLEREKYTKTAETFMDVYISIVIAAPMILMVLLIIMSAAHLAMSFTPVQITLLLIFAISLLNIIFLVMLQNKQPTY